MPADLPLEGLPPAAPVGPGDYSILVQGAGLKALPPSRPIGGTLGASVVTIDMAFQLGTLTAFLLNVVPDTGCAIRIETSRNSGGSWQTYGGTGVTWNVPVSVLFAKDPTDINFVTNVRLTRTAGSSVASVYTVQAGIVAFTGMQDAMRGTLNFRVLVVDPTLRTRQADPNNDRGIVFGSFGIDQNIIEIQNEATAPWDRSNGPVMFAVWRLSTATCDVNPANGGVGTGAGVVIEDPFATELPQWGMNVWFSDAANHWVRM